MHSKKHFNTKPCEGQKPFARIIKKGLKMFSAPIVAFPTRALGTSNIWKFIS